MTNTESHLKTLITISDSLPSELICCFLNTLIAFSFELSITTLYYHNYISKMLQISWSYCKYIYKNAIYDE